MAHREITLKIPEIQDPEVLSDLDLIEDDNLPSNLSGKYAGLSLQRARPPSRAGAERVPEPRCGIFGSAKPC